MSDSSADRASQPEQSLPRRRPVADGDRSDGAASSGREAYNVVTDTIAGPNLRRRDNVFQAIFIGVCLLIAVPVGAIFGGWGGVLAGALGALVIGVILSGAMLGIYRAVRHMQGKHD